MVAKAGNIKRQELDRLFEQELGCDNVIPERKRF